MTNYEDLKRKAKDALDTLADVSVEAFKLAEEKARVIAKKAKLKAGITNERATIRRLKVEIGGIYYRLHKDAPEESLKEQCEEVTAALDRIAAKQRELEELRNCSTCDAEDDEAEDADVESAENEAEAAEDEKAEAPAEDDKKD